MSRYLKWNDKTKCYDIKPGGATGIINDYIYSTQLLNLIKKYVADEEIVKLCESIRYVEDTVRNRVAHEMVGISDDFIKSKAGWGSVQIMQMIQKLMYSIDGGLKKHWDSYDKMNALILDRMETEII